MTDKEQCLIWLNESITRSAIRILSNQASNNCGGVYWSALFGEVTFKVS